MAISYVGISTLAGEPTTTTPTWPASYTPTAGDLAIVVVLLTGYVAPTPDHSTPSGWTLLAKNNEIVGYDATTGDLYAFIRVLAGSDTLPTFTDASGSWCRSYTIIYSGVDTTTPSDATPVLDAVNPGASWQPAGITTVTDGAEVLSLFANPRYTAPPGPGTANGFTTLLSDGGYPSQGAARITKATAGAQTMPTWTSDSDGVGHIALALRPAAEEAEVIPAYTELEWSIGIQAPAVADDVYEFRVFYDDADTPLDSYAVTPQLTVASEEGPIEVAIPTAILRLGGQTVAAAGAGDATAAAITPAVLRLGGQTVTAANEAPPVATVTLHITRSTLVL